MIKFKKYGVLFFIVVFITYVVGINKLVAKAEGVSGNIPLRNSTEEVLTTYDTDGTNIAGNDRNLIKQALDNKIKPQLDELGITCKKIKQAKKVHDNFLNEDKYVIGLDNQTVELNLKFELEKFSSSSNNETSSNINGLYKVNNSKGLIKSSKEINIESEPKKLINNKNEVEPVIDKIKKSLSMVNDFQLTQNESFNEDIWILVWERNLGKGIINPYESLKIFVNRSDGSIQTFKIYNEEPNTLNNKITSDEAVKISNDIMIKCGDESKIKTSLKVFKPNYYWTKG